MNILCEHAPVKPPHGPRSRRRRIDDRASVADAADFVARFVRGESGPSILTPKTRALAGLAALTAAKATGSQIKAHVRAARAAGASRDEVLETILEAALYSGFAAARRSLDAAFEVFADPDRKLPRQS